MQSNELYGQNVYGATGNKWFPYFDLRVAESITSTGQVAIRYIGNRINTYMNTLLKTTGVEYAIYEDTDSVAGDSIITVNGNRLTIAEYFEQVYGKAYESGKMVLPVEGDFTLCSPDGNNIAERKINYIMAHKTKKKMYRITVNGSSVDVTEDHSVMVMRDGVLCEAKPADIKKGDSIIFTKY